MSSLVGEAFVRIRPKMDSFQHETEQGFAKSFKGVAEIVGAAFATHKVIDFGKEIVKSAAATKRATETIRDGFGEAGEKVTEFNEHAAAQLGISAEAGQTAAAKFAQLFSTLGIGQGKAADMTVNLEKMAGGLAQIKGTDPSEVLDKLYSASTGATRGLKSLGIVIDGNTIKAKAAELGLITHVRSTKASEAADLALAIAKAKVNAALEKYGPNTTQVAQAQITLERAQNAVKKAIDGTASALTPAQKSQATYAALMDKLPGILDKAKSHSDDLSVSQQRLKAEWANVKDELGKRLLPVVEDVVKWFADRLPGAIKKTQDKVKEVTDRISGPFNGGLEKAKGTLEGVADALRATVKFLIQYQNIFLPISGAIGGVTLAMEAWTIATEVWTTVTKVATAVQTAFNLAMKANTISIIVLAIAALVGALVVLYQRNETVRHAIQEGWAELHRVAVRIWGAIRDYVLDAWNIIKVAFVTELKVMRDVFLVFKSVFTGDWSGAWKHFKDIFSDIWHGISKIAGIVLDDIRDYVEKKALQIGLKIIEPFSHIPRWLGGGWAQDLKAKMTGALDDLNNPAARAGTAVGGEFGARALDQVNSYMGSIQNAVDNAWRGVESSVSRDANASPNRSGGFTRGASLSNDQIRALVRQAGGSSAEAAYLAAIAGKESGGRTQALNDNASTGDYSVGLFQINYFKKLLASRTRAYGSPSFLATHPLAQARAALSILHGQGPSAWSTNTPALQAILGGRTGGGSPPPSGTEPPLTVGSASTAAVAMTKKQIAAAEDSLNQTLKGIIHRANQNGVELTGTVKKHLDQVRKEIAGISGAEDVRTARDHLKDLGTAVSDQAAAIRTHLNLEGAFHSVVLQVAKLGEESTPAIRAQMEKVRAELGKAVTPGEVAKVKAQMATLKAEISKQLEVIKATIDAKKSLFDSAWQRVASGADAAFDRATQKAIKNMQVTVQGAFAAFQFGGSLTQTPAEKELAALTAAHDAAANAAKRAADEQALAAAKATGTAEDIAAAQATVNDDVYNDQVAALTARAQVERDAATQQLQDAQDAYTRQRDLLKQQMDDRVAAIETGMLNGTIAAADGMAQLTAVFGDPQYGLDIKNAGVVLGGQLYAGLSEALEPTFKMLNDLIDLMKKAGLLSGATKPTPGPGKVTLPGGLTVGGGVLGSGFGGAYGAAGSGGVADALSRYLDGNDKKQAQILDELKKQTAAAEDGKVIAVAIEGGANKVAKAVAR